MPAIELQIRLNELQAERLLASGEGLAADTAYMAELGDVTTLRDPAVMEQLERLVRERQDEEDGR